MEYLGMRASICLVETHYAYLQAGRCGFDPGSGHQSTSLNNWKQGVALASRSVNSKTLMMMLNHKPSDAL